MSEVIDVHFSASSYENRKGGIAILVNVEELFPTGIYPPNKKKIEKNMKTGVIERVVIGMTEEFERQRYDVPGFSRGPVKNKVFEDKYKRENMLKKRTFLNVVSYRP